nr:hypothetical protein [Tanacetum cinerariifolium]
MNAGIQKFNQLVSETLAHIGENDEDWMTRVEVWYKTHVGGDFKHKSAWLFLKSKHNWTNPESTNARRSRFRVTDEEPEHFGDDVLPQLPELQRIDKSQSSGSNLTASSGSNPMMYQEFMKEQYELDRKVKMQFLVPFFILLTWHHFLRIFKNGMSPTARPFPALCGGVPARIAMSVFVVDDLSPVKDNIKLRVRILRAFLQPLYNNQQVKNMEMIVMDEHNSKMQATVRMDKLKRFQHHLKEGNALTIQRYSPDVVGQFIACEDLDNYDKNGKAGKKPFTLIDDEGNEIKCTLWGDYAQQFNDFLNSCDDHGMIVLVLQFAMMF